MSDLPLAHLLLLVLLNMLLVSNIFGMTKWGLDKQTLWEIQQLAVGTMALIAFTEIAMGRVLHGIVSGVMAGGFYYIFRRRNGGGGKKYDNKSIFSKYAPW